MMTEKRDDAADGELVATVTADPITEAFAAAIGTVLDMLPESFARQTIVKENMAAHERTKQALVRRWVN
jgi:hypothetical protein